MDHTFVADTMMVFKTTITKHYKDFNGRTDRTTFWSYIVVYVAIRIALQICSLAVTASFFVFVYASAIFSLALVIPTAAIVVRRLHDGERNGLIVLPLVALMVTQGLVALFAPIYSIAAVIYLLFNFELLYFLAVLLIWGYVILIIVWCAQPGTIGPNAYGPDPKTA